jgi:hypothetical protein
LLCTAAAEARFCPQVLPYRRDDARWTHVCGIALVYVLISLLACLLSSMSCLYSVSHLTSLNFFIVVKCVVTYANGQLVMNATRLSSHLLHKTWLMLTFQYGGCINCDGTQRTSEVATVWLGPFPTLAQLCIDSIVHYQVSIVCGPLRITALLYVSLLDFL